MRRARRWTAEPGHPILPLMRHLAGISCIFLFFGALGACGDDTGGTTADECAGLGCPSCDAGDLNTEICVSSSSCDAVSDCEATLPGSCDMNLGTSVTAFRSAACLGGRCAYRVISAGCIDATPCDQCVAQGEAGSCGLRPTAAECASCCETYYAGSDYAAVFQGCACGAGGPCAAACGTSALCGGQGPETDECTACLAGTLLDDGACVASGDFQAACIQEQGSVFCKKLAQCLATCPAP